MIKQVCHQDTWRWRPPRFSPSPDLCNLLKLAQTLPEGQGIWHLLTRATPGSAGGTPTSWRHRGVQGHSASLIRGKGKRKALKWHLQRRMKRGQQSSPRAPTPTMLWFASGVSHWLIKSSFLAHFSPEICFLCIEHLLQLQIHAPKKEQLSLEAAYHNGVQSGLPHPEKERELILEA